MALDQSKTPFFTKLLEYAKSDVVSHDVPGHKLGRLENDLIKYTGNKIFRLDANAPKGLDNLNKPKGVLKEAESLMAEAFKANKAFLLTGGTTLGILAMIMSTVRAKEKIIMPRNVHKSAINALILSGAIPIFIKPQIDRNLGIANHISYEDVKMAILENPDAKAIFLINPTYFGAISNLVDIVKLAHSCNMVVMVDEAHGAHYGFSDCVPLSAMQAKADLSAASLHKTVGSLTQSSVLLAQGNLIDYENIRATINMIQSTSPSSLLLASLDVARKYIYFEAPKRMLELVTLANETRKRIEKIAGLESLGKEYFLKQGCHDYDETKLVVKVSNLGITGFDVYNELALNHHIQIELAETNLILCVLSIGTNKDDMDRLVDALAFIAKKYLDKNLDPIKPKLMYSYPEAFTRPREAFHAPKKYVKLLDAENEIAAESIMIYPPGIPVVIPGEIISEDIIELLMFYKKSDSTILSDSENELVKVIDKENWYKWEIDDDL